jgi:hypothetical protein
MISINKKIFYEVFDKNIDLYYEFIRMLSNDYKKTINNISTANNVADLRKNIHSLIGIVSNFDTMQAQELIYLCKTTLLIHKDNPEITLEMYLQYTQQIVNFDKNKLGL